MHVTSLSLTNFRNYERVDLRFESNGLVVIHGDNGQGKTNLLEAVSFLSTSKSFRESSAELMINANSDTAIVRGEGQNNGRDLLVEAEIQRTGRNRLNVNKQAIRRSRTLEETIAVTTFSPNDLELVKSGPSNRRSFVDDLLAGSDERQRAHQSDLERILKQRNALLKQSGGRLSVEVTATLDVWDERLAAVAEIIGQERSQLTKHLEPLIQKGYEEISGISTSRVGIDMVTDWRIQDGAKGMLDALRETRQQDAARGTTSKGPHRDDLRLTINDMPARTHASQGEQRSLAIALRLAGHRYVAVARESVPVLLLDDVFSELDDKRTEQLLSTLPLAQCFLATAVAVPNAIKPVQEIRISRGTIVE